MSTNQYVFGYGGLAHPERLATFLNRPLMKEKDYVLGRVLGFRRCWNGAHDFTDNGGNTAYLVERQTNTPVKAFSTHLNICESPKDNTNGVIFRLTHEELRQIDIRERNWKRIDITDCIQKPIPGKVWTYMAGSQALGLYDEGRQLGLAIILMDYFNLVVSGFKYFGEDWFSEFLASTDEPEVEIKDLIFARQCIPCGWPSQG